MQWQIFAILFTFYIGSAIQHAFGAACTADACPRVFIAALIYRRDKKPASYKNKLISR